jgi:zinc D-Ala-D-Ala dipeptidase
MKILKFYLLFFTFGFLLSCREKEKTEEQIIVIEKDSSTKIAIEDSLLGKAIEDSMQAQGLVNVQEVSSNILVELKYSTEDNFFKKDVYGSFSKAFLQKKPAEGLNKAQDYLTETNLNLKLIIYDAARPLHIQEILWHALDSIPPVRRKDYVADPAEGSIHNYGSAVDLSIFDIESKLALDMGTKYDFFGPLAYPKNEQSLLRKGLLTETQINNRKLLRKVMAKGGFQPITSEWWHFNYYSRDRAKKLFAIIK